MEQQREEARDLNKDWQQLVQKMRVLALEHLRLMGKVAYEAADQWWEDSNPEDAGRN